MYKHAYILSSNASLFDFLSKKLLEACDLTATSFPTEERNHDGRILIMVESHHFLEIGLEAFISGMKRKFKNADIVIFGESDDHVNQQFILSGAIDFLNPRMLTSPAFTSYLQLRAKRDWSLQR